MSTLNPVLSPAGARSTPPPLRHLYARRWNIPEGQFEYHLLPRVLHLPARLAWWLVHGLAPEHFEPDKDFLRELAVAHSVREAEAAVREFRGDPRNRTVLRRFLKVRVSVEKVIREIEPLLEGTQ